MKIYIASLALLFSLSSCTQNDTLDMESGNMKDTSLGKKASTLTVSDFPKGTIFSLAKIATQGAYNQLTRDLDKSDAISIVAEVDHQQNAKSVGLELNETRIVFFGNPRLGTPLMQKNQLAGLDLPQKVLFYKDEDKTDIALYNSVDYLRSRHGLDGVGTLSTIENALANLVSSNTKGNATPAAQQTVGLEEGIITKESTRSVDASYAALKSAIENNPNLRVIAELNHKANAASVGLELRPTRIIIFGNPNLGTPLMQSSQSMGLDLPQKMLIWEAEDGTVYVSYNDINYLVERHGVEGNEGVISTIENALNNLSNVAAGN